MCNFFSCILTRTGQVFWDPDITSHEELVNKNKLNDSKLKDRDFVRVEVTPNHRDSFFSRERSGWTIKIDEPGTLPEWYCNDDRRIREIIWTAWEKAMSETLWELRLELIPIQLEELKHIGWFKMAGEKDPSWRYFEATTWAAAWAAARAAAGDAAWAAAWAAAGDAAWDAARDAAGDAAWDAAGDAAGDAAWAAAWAAARDAAWDAAWDAARDAAWAAAGDAAWAAARDAAWAAAWDAAISICPEGTIDQKHINYMAARMEVWKRGYALLCDVDGVLYVYGVSA
jgi:hypothetical protein